MTIMVKLKNLWFFQILESLFEANLKETKNNPEGHEIISWIYS